MPHAATMSVRRFFRKMSSAYFLHNHVYKVLLFYILCMYTLGITLVCPTVLKHHGYPERWTEAVFFIISTVIMLQILLNLYYINSVKSFFEGGAPLAADGSDLHPEGLYPYLKWKPCFTCRQWRPPRCHHCPLCERCVLKRDHHCFYSKNCVGLKNQRHFLLFLFWCVLGQLYASAFIMIYIWEFFLSRNSYADLFLPVAAGRFLAGVVIFSDVISLLVLYFLVYFLILAFNFFVEQLSNMISGGLTSWEADAKFGVLCTASLSQIVSQIFGRKRWYLNLLWPGSHVFEPSAADGHEWPELLMRREKYIRVRSNTAKSEDTRIPEMCL